MLSSFDSMSMMTFYSVVTQKQSAGTDGDGFEVCGDGWRWDQNPISMQISTPVLMHITNY